MNFGQIINLFHLYIKGPATILQAPWKRMGDGEGCVPDRGIIDIVTNKHLKLNPFIFMKR